MWLSVSLPADEAQAGPLSEALMEQGALSVSIEDADAGTPEETPQFGEPGTPAAPLWEHSRVVALFEPAADLPQRIAAAAVSVGVDASAVQIEEVAEQDWVRLTQSQFAPIRITDQLWIVPSWHVDAFDRGEYAQPPVRPKAEHALSVEASQEAEPSSPLSSGKGKGEGVRLILDPGLAFGTGSHPTTWMCLEWLATHIRGGEQVLDYGCGSGILAIAAARLGAASVTGVDIDEHALTAAQANATTNQVALALQHSREPLVARFDIVVANILTNPLCVLAPLLAARVAVGGRLVLAGVLAHQAEQVIAAYAPFIALHAGAEREGWVRLEGHLTGA